MSNERTPRAGDLRYWSETEKQWVVARPGDALYSTVTMAATQWFNQAGEWVNIFDESTD